MIKWFQIKGNRIVFIAVIILILMLWALDFGCKDKSLEESKNFYYKNKDELNSLSEDFILNYKLIGIRTIEPGLGAVSCNQPIKWLRIMGALDSDFEMPIVWSIENVKNQRGLKNWCEENNIDYNFVLRCCELVINNDIYYLGRTNLYGYDFEVSFSIRTGIINLIDANEISNIDARTKVRIENNWFYTNTFE